MEDDFEDDDMEDDMEDEMEPFTLYENDVAVNYDFA